MSNMDNGGVENVTRTQKGWRWRLRILTNSFTKIMTQLILCPTLHRSRSHPHSHKKDLPGTGDSQEHWTEYSNLPDSTTWAIVYPSFIPSWPCHFSFASGPSSDLQIALLKEFFTAVQAPKKTHSSLCTWRKVQAHWLVCPQDIAQN